MLYNDISLTDYLFGTLYGLGIALLVAVCAYVVCWIVLLIHEGGHFLAARSVGAKIDEVVLGNGPLLRKGEREGIAWEVRLQPTSGYVSIHEGMYAVSVRDHSIVVLGGPLASLLLAVGMTVAFYPAIWRKPPTLNWEQRSEEMATRLRRSVTEEFIFLIGTKLVPRALVLSSWAAVFFSLVPTRMPFSGGKIASDGLPTDGLQLYWLWFPDWKRAGKTAAEPTEESRKARWSSSRSSRNKHRD